MQKSLQIDRLWQGEAGTAPFQRRAGQVSRSRNVRFDIAVGGAVKRNPTILIGDLDGDSAANVFDPSKDFHWVSIRGATIAIGDADMFGWDANAQPLHIVDNTGGAFYTYIDVPNPLRHITTAVSFDTIIVCNRRKSMKVATLDCNSHQQSLNFIINGDRTNSTGVPTVATNMSTRTVDDFSRLPPQSLPQSTYEATRPEWLNDPANGDIFRTRYDYQLDPAGIYVYWDGPVHSNARGYFPQHGNWHRIPINRQPNGRFDETTMPYRVVYQEATGTLTISACPWSQRVSGNQATNHRLPIVGHSITAVAFHSGRLFLIGSNQQVCSSRTDDYFNLWLDNVNAVSDADRIATPINESDIGEVLHAKTCGRSLFINCEQGQLEFHSGGEILTNTNGQIRRIMSLQARDVEPASTANAIVVLDEFGDLHQFEYTNVDVGIVYTEMLTIHRRKLLWDRTPLSMFMLDSTLYVCIDGGDMLVHDSFTVQGELVQSAWGEYTMQDNPVLVHAWDGEVLIVTRNEDTANDMYSLLSYLHREQEPDEPMVYMPRLDRMELIPPTEMTYIAASDTTVMRHAGKEGDIDRSFVVMRDDYMVHKFIKCRSINGDGNPVFSGDLTETEQYLGFTFDTELVLTKIYPGLTAEGLVMSRLTVFHYETTDYGIRAQLEDGSYIPEDGPHKWQSQRVTISRIGVPPFETHFYEFSSIQGDPRRIEITLSSSTPGQCAWLGLEYAVTATGPGTSG